MSFDSSFPQRGPSTPVFHTTTTHTTYPASSISTTAAYGVLLSLVTYYLLHYFEAYYLPLSELLWNTLVFVTPSQMLSRLDPKFSPSASQDSGNDKDNTPKGFDSQHHASKSNSLRRLMGLDSNTGIMTVVQRTRTLSDLSNVFKSKPLNSLPGLGNWDHSCYQNSVIQGLASLDSLRIFLGQEETEDAQGQMIEGSTRKALRELTEKLNDENNVGKTFWTPSELKSMSSWQQQDAQEYFSKVMDGLEKDAASAQRIKDRLASFETLSTNDKKVWKKAPSKEGDPTLRTSRMNQLPTELQAVLVRNPLDGLLAQRVGCQKCGYVEGLSLVPFNCLTVSLGRRWMYDIRECLDEYTALEPINGVECAKCTLKCAMSQISQMLGQLSNKTPPDGKEDYDKRLTSLQEDAQKRLDHIEQILKDEDFSDSALKKCQIPAKNHVSTTKSRQAVVARAPKALAIHVNRSIFDELTGEQSKNQATVRFPQRFGLGPWCLGSQAENLEASIEYWNTDPTQSMLNDVADDQGLDTGPLYELRAVVTHYGRHENGHYICYRRSPYTVKADVNVAASNTERSEPWWRLSDEEVTEVSEETVLAQGGVFMLFYEQVPPQGPVPAPNMQQGPEETIPVTSEQAEAIPHESADDKPPTFMKLEMSEQRKVEPRISSVYPTPPPEEFDDQATPEPEGNPLSQDQPHPTKEPSQPSSPLKPPEHTSEHTPQDKKDTYNHPPIEEVPPSKATTPTATPATTTTTTTTTTATSPPPTPTPISPRTGRGSGRRTAGKAMESMAGFVQAN